MLQLKMLITMTKVNKVMCEIDTNVSQGNMIQGNIPNVMYEKGTGADTVLECHLNEHVQVNNDGKQVIQGTNVNGNVQDSICTPAPEAVTTVPQVNTIHSPYLSSYVPLQI